MDKVTDKKKILILFVAIIAFVTLIAGGTYAWMSFTGALVSNNGNTLATCFVIEEDYTDEDGTTSLNGTLIQSSKPKNGLSGTVGMRIRPDCGIAGVGHIYLTVNEATASVLYKKAPARCENPTTLETMKDYNDASSCTSAGGTWVPANTHSALKYAVYENVDENPVAVGHIDGTGKMTLHGNFELSHENKLHYVYIWLDGNLADNTYMGVSFDGYIHLGANQIENYLELPENPGKEYASGEAIAIYSASDNSLRFYREENPDSVTVGSTYNGRPVTEVYTGFENSTNVPWASLAFTSPSLTTVVFEEYIYPISTAYWFDQFSSVSSIDATKLDTSSVTNMHAMFWHDSSTVITGLENWDTSNVTDMGSMFGVYYGDITGIENWDVSNVTNMNQMFWYSQASGNLENWDTSNVTDMGSMFFGYSGSITGIGNWDTSSVTNMRLMFVGASASDIVGIENWDTSNVTNMDSMFDEANPDLSLDLSSWKVCKIPTRPSNFSTSSNIIEPYFGNSAKCNGGNPNP